MAKGFLLRHMFIMEIILKNSLLSSEDVILKQFAVGILLIIIG
jgi:hypothetical protein